MIFENKLYQEDLDHLICDSNIWKALKGKNILITGASGMIGTLLIDVLMKRNEIYQDGITVCALSRNKEKLETKFSRYMGNQFFQTMVQDISVGFWAESRSFDYLIHGASNTHPKEYAEDPAGTITTNVFGTFHLLEYARKKKGCRVILLSSVEVYGENRGDTTYFGEEYCGYINCNTVRAGYPESKRVSESLLQAYIAQYQVDGLQVRLSRTYGPTVERDDSKAISQFIRNAVFGEDIVLKSEGRQLYSYCYVADSVDAILRCMAGGKCGEAYNVADKASDISLRDMAEYLARFAGTKVVFELPNDKEKRGYSAATRALMNSDKLQGLGWRARYSIREGLERTILILRDEREESVGIMENRI